MGRYPQTQSSPVTSMCAELNAIIGEQHFRVLYNAHARQYDLVLTELGKISKKYSFLETTGLQFSEMFEYLNGVLLGYRLAKQILKI